MSEQTPAELQRLVSEAYMQAADPTAPDYELLRKVVQHLSDLVVLPQDKLAPPLAQVIDHLLGTLIPFASNEQKKRLVSRLSGFRSLPRRTGSALLQEQIDISRTLIESQVIISDEELIRLLTTQSSEHGRLVAMREGLSELVGRVIVEQCDVEVVEALLGNRSVSIGRPSYKRLFDLAHERAPIRDLLLDRADLPIDMAIRFLPTLNSDQRLRLIQRSITDRSVLHDIFPGDVLDRLSMIDGKIRDGLRTLHRITPFTPEAEQTLLKAAQTLTREEICNMAGEISGVTPYFVRFTADDVNGDLFAVFAKGAGLTRDTTEELSERLFPQAALFQDGDETMKAAMRIYDALSWDAAAGIVRLWEFAIQDVWQQ